MQDRGHEPRHEGTPRSWKKNEQIFFFCIFLEEHSLADSLALGLLTSRDDKEPGN